VVSPGCSVFRIIVASVLCHERTWATILLVLHRDKPEAPRELLHEINNQVEIVMFAAEVLGRQCSDPSSKECCAQIQTAIFRTSKILKTYFKVAIPLQPAPSAAAEVDMPVAVDRV
jgi:2-keto-4-pentenoate hydratase